MMSQEWNIAQRMAEQRPLALLNSSIKWLTTFFLLQLTDVFQQVTPAAQKGFLPGRQMVEHTIAVVDFWNQSSDCILVAMDFAKAYDSVQQHVRGTTPGGVRSVVQFEDWASSVGMVLTPDMLSYIRLATRTRQPPGHLGTSCIAYSRLLRRFAAPPPPPSGREAQLGVWHSSLFTDSKARSAALPKLVRCGFASWREVFSDG